MTGEVYQILTLIAYGNANLQCDYNIKDIININNAFKFCNSVSFVKVKKNVFGKRKEIEIARTPEEWFSYLKSKSCRVIRMKYFENTNENLPTHIASAFVGGGGHWIINCCFDEYSELWNCKWSLTQRDDPQNRIWTVAYTNLGESSKVDYNNFINLDNSILKLKEVLYQIEIFARTNDAVNFADIFQKSLQMLDNADNFETYFNDIIPNGFYPANSKRLLFSAGNAWVFGGMGSWNDMYFEKEETQKEYDILSSQLYKVINQSIEDAINSFSTKNKH